MIYSTQMTNTDIVSFIDVLVLSYYERQCLVHKLKRQWKLLKSGLLLRKIANFTGKLLR